MYMTLWALTPRCSRLECIDRLVELPEDNIAILDFVCLALLLVFAVRFDLVF